MEEYFRKANLLEWKLYAWFNFVACVFYMFFSLHCMLKDDKLWILSISLAVFYYTCCILFKRKIKNA